MVDNPISGHTAGTNDGLRDGDHILSPSLTNIYEGLHGNGVLLAHDTAYGDTNRNNPAVLPGAISAGAAAHQVLIKACSVVLDGIPYTIDNGAGGDLTIDLTDELTAGSAFLAGTTATPLLTTKECLFVILATSLGAKWVQTTPVTAGTGNYADIAGSIADSYLKMHVVSAASNKQSLVLGVVRAVFNGSAAAANDLDLTLSEFNDKRVFIRPSPFYLSPVTTGAIGATTHVNSHTILEDVHVAGGAGQEGDFGANGVMWLSYNEVDNLPNLYFSAKDGSNRHTHLLGPNRIQAYTGAAHQLFTFDEAQVFIYTPSGAINLNPTGTFPPGHTVIVSATTNAVTFDTAGLNSAVAASTAVMFTYDGTNWKRLMVSSSVSTTSHGATGLVQLSDGSGGFTSDAKLFWTAGSSTFTVNGKLTVTGLIDPTGLELTPVGANPGGTAANTLWMDTGASNALKHGANTVLNSASSVADLSDVTAAGSGSIISGAERTKLNAIEASADVTDEANIKAALSGTLSAISTATVAAGDLVFVRDVDDSNNVKTVSASSIGGLGGGGGSTTAIVDGDADTKVDVEVSADADTIVMHTVGVERVVIDTNVNLGVDVDIVFEGSAANVHETTLTVTNPDADRTITLPNLTGTVALTSQIPTTPAIYDNSGTPAFTSGITKAEILTLINVEDNADVTDATNVASAGAVMAGNPIPFVPANAALWVAPPPPTLTIAIERLAAAVAGGHSGPVA